jgi:hypothetical protein
MTSRQLTNYWTEVAPASGFSAPRSLGRFPEAPRKRDENHGIQFRIHAFCHQANRTDSRRTSLLSHEASHVNWAK